MTRVACSSLASCHYYPPSRFRDWENAAGCWSECWTAESEREIVQDSCRRAPDGMTVETIETDGSSSLWQVPLFHVYVTRIQQRRYGNKNDLRYLGRVYLKRGWRGRDGNERDNPVSAHGDPDRVQATEHLQPTTANADLLARFAQGSFDNIGVVWLHAAARKRKLATMVRERLGAKCERKPQDLVLHIQQHEHAGIPKSRCWSRPVTHGLNRLKRHSKPSKRLCHVHGVTE